MHGTRTAVLRRCKSTHAQARMRTFNRMAFTSYGYDKMNRQLWATMPPMLCRDVRDAAITRSSDRFLGFCKESSIGVVVQW